VGLDRTELASLVQSLGEPRFRGDQLFRWIYGRGVTSFDEMSNLPKRLRRKLDEVAQVGSVRLVRSQRSAVDGTVKCLFELHDGRRVESVLMSEDSRRTVCVSSQVGCAIDCQFCATGRMGFLRNLTAGEIVDQVLAVQRLEDVQVTNVVMMGMGEPFHNYDAVIKACGLISDPEGPCIGARHIVVSTSGLVPMILRYADEGHRYRLAISLNATTDELRDRLMPLNRRWPIAELLHAAKYYTERSGQRVTFEYVLMEGLNDSLEDARRLKHLLQPIPCKLNLIPYNSTSGPFRRPSEKRLLAFYGELKDMRAPVTIRWSKGVDIDAACGQLATAEKGKG
jgi:23S rRNA (adenine2503-C2)-methyltransferase